MFYWVDGKAYFASRHKTIMIAKAFIMNSSVSHEVSPNARADFAQSKREKMNRQVLRSNAKFSQE